MRKPIVAGNWKMNKTAEEATSLVQELIPVLDSIDSVDNIVCPPFMAIPVLHPMLRDTTIGLGAQNMHWKDSGAFTGEVSPLMVKEFCKFVIIGHSERRQFFGETDETVNLKIKAALAHDLSPIVCIGETLEQNENGDTEKVLRDQILKGFKEISAADFSKVIIAYEPVWAIGTGRAATPEVANTIHKDVIRELIKRLYGEDIAESLRILYGGSVKPANAAAFFAQTDIDGALVGGASLNANDFIAITKAAVF